MAFTDSQIETIMEAAKMEVKHYNYFPGYAGSYWEPPEPEELEIQIVLTVNIQPNRKYAKAIQELKQEPYFRQYCEMYLQEVLKKRLYDDELQLWETYVSSEDIKIELKDNLLTIEVYHSS